MGAALYIFGVYNFSEFKRTGVDLLKGQGVSSVKQCM